MMNRIVPVVLVIGCLIGVAFVFYMAYDLGRMVAALQ